MTTDGRPSPAPALSEGVERGLWMGLYAASFLGRILQSPAGAIADEELHTPTVAAWLAGGGALSALPELQYTAPCGGCTAEAVLVAPLFALLGPGLVVWKLVALGFGLAITALLWAVASRAGGRAAARGTAAAWVFAPTWVGANTVVAFGGHFEVMALVLGALLLACGGERLTPRRAAGVGLLAGGAFWFDYASAFSLPVLAGLLAWRGAPRARAAAAFAGGAALGLLPWLATQTALSRSGALGGASWLSVAGRDPDALVAEGPGWATRASELAGPDLWISMFNPLLSPDRPLVGAAVTGAALLAWGLTAARAVRRREPLVVAAAALPALYALAYLALAPTGMARPAGAPLPANALRYLIPLAPLLALCVGLAQGAAPRGLGRAAALVVVGTGLTFRLAEVQPRAWTTRPLHVVALDRQALADRPVLGEERGGRAGELTRVAEGYQRLGEEVVRAQRLGRSPAGPLREEGDEGRLEGVALRLQHDGGWLDGGSAATPPPRLGRLLAPLPAAPAQALARALLRYERHPAVDLAAEQLRDGADPWRGATGPWPEAVAATAALRTAFDLAEDRASPATWPVRVRQRAAPLAGSTRAAWMAGLGAALGERLLHQPADLDHLAQALDPDDQAPFRRGLAEGTARVAW